jgi:VWFA-related protein
MRNCGSGKLLSVLLASALVAVANPAWAQLRASAVYTSSDAASDTGFPRLRVVVTPPDPRTPPQAGDLILVEDGRDQNHAVEVRSFESTGYPLTAAVVIDVSGSMAGKPMEMVRRSLVQFVNDARPKDKIAVMTLADDARWDAPFGADRETVRQQIAAIAPRGHLTRLYDGLIQAMGDFTPALPQRRELTVISDGHDEGSQATLEQVVEMAHNRGIAIDAIGMTRSDVTYLKILESMAEQTGGSFRAAQSDEELQSLVGNAIANLKATPVASFDCDRITPDGKHHQLAVRWKKANLLSNTVGFNAPSKAAHPVKYFFKRLPVWALPVAAGVLLLVVVGIVLAILSARKRKSQDAPYVQPFTPDYPRPDEPEPPTYHLPTAEIEPQRVPTVSEEPLVAPPSSYRPRAPQLTPAPIPAPENVAASVKADRRKTALGGIFQPAAGSLGKLEAEAGVLAGRSFDINRDTVLQGRFWIGATPGCAVEIGEDPTVSGYHAYLVFEDPILILVDNNSTNGTWLNGEQFRGAPRPLKPNDRIQIGRTQFRIVA